VAVVASEGAGAGVWWRWCVARTRRRAGRRWRRCGRAWATAVCGIGIGDDGVLWTRRRAGSASARARDFRLAAAHGTAMAAAWAGVGNGGGASLPLKAFSGKRPPLSSSGSRMVKGRGGRELLYLRTISPGW
jgi:hypothetical protein